MHAVAVSHDLEAEIQRERKQGKDLIRHSLEYLIHENVLLSNLFLARARLNDNPDFQVSCYATRPALANIYLAESKARWSIESITPECCGGAR